MRFAIFPVHVSKILRLPRKSEARSYEVLHLSRKIILANLEDLMLFQNATPLRKFPPWSPNKSIAHVSLVLRLLHDMHLAISSAYVPRLPSFLKLLQNFHVLLNFDKVPNLLRLPRETTSERPKVLRTPQCYLHFWPWNLLRTTTACTFSTCQLPKVLWDYEL